jgi:hypothetical protein
MPYKGRIGLGLAGKTSANFHSNQEFYFISNLLDDISKKLKIAAFKLKPVLTPFKIGI